MSYECIEDVSIYVGPACNFNCKYCDRAYVNDIGVDAMSYGSALIDFIVNVVENADDRIMVSFHGGEPLVYIKLIKSVMAALLVRIPDFKDKAIFFLQTNGSLIAKQRDFFEMYKDILFVSISYDFKHQDDNRTSYDIEEALQLLNDLNIGVQFQYVIPTNQKNVFSIEAYSHIVRLYKQYRINSINLILLRHIRHEQYFETVIADESLDLKKFFLGFIQFVQLLYVAGINIAIDGHAKKIDKNYYANHKQMVLAPNGMIVPEYQFIEYDNYDFAIGRWKPFVQINREKIPPQAEAKIRQECKTCPMTDLCGLRYHYAMFDIDPPAPSRCKEFYMLNKTAIKHLYRLKEQPTLLHHLGVQE